MSWGLPLLLQTNEASGCSDSEYSPSTPAFGAAGAWGGYPGPLPPRIEKAGHLEVAYGCSAACGEDG